MINCRSLFLVLLIHLVTGLQPAFAESKQEVAARYYEDALQRFEQDDTAGAIIQLKNALQQDPKMLTARVLLGKAYLRQHDPASAEQELTKALQLGVDRSEVVVSLAQALLGQGKYQVLLDQYFLEGLPTEQQVGMLLVRGQAYRSLGDTKSALRAFQDAGNLNPGNVPAMLAQADVLAYQGKLTEASALVDRALSVTPKDASVWNIKAGIALAAGDTVAALSTYSKSLALDPRSADARVARASLLLGLGRDAEAATDIEYLKRENPYEPRGIYLRAVYLARKGDNAGTREALADVTRALDPVPRAILKFQATPLLMIGGLAHYGLGDTEKARSYFEEYLTVDPRNPNARKLLGSILLGRGDVKEAITTLEVAHRVAPSDPQVLSLLAAAQMTRGDYRIATRYLEQALQAGGGNADVHATLGFSLLGIGQRELALDHLRQAFAKDPGQYRVGAALAVLYLRHGQPKEAATVADAVAQHDPSNIFVLNLAGVAKAGAGDRAGARAAYLKAIAVDQTFIPAQLNLGKLEFLEGNHAAARERFKAILKMRPKETQAMYELALVEASMGATPEAIRWLEKAHALNRRDVRVTSRLVDLQLLLKNVQGAVTAANETQLALPDNLDALSALGQANAAAGSLKRARASFERMELLAGANAEWQYRVAWHFASIGDLHGAARCLGKALSVKPDYPAAQIRLAEVELQTGDVAKSEQRAKAIANRYPSMAIGRRLLADVALAKKSYPEAIAGYRGALAIEPDTDGAIRLYNAYIQSGNVTKATEHIDAWVRAHPGDAIAMHALAEAHLKAGDLAAARSWYEELLKIVGEQPVTLNNLANVLAKQGDTKAVSYAERAHAAAPNDAAILDTLGWVLVQQNQPEKGLRYLREARLRGSQNNEIRYHLAVALSRTGRPDEARTELEPVVVGNTAFEGSEDARKLWRELSGP